MICWGTSRLLERTRFRMSDEDRDEARRLLFECAYTTGVAGLQLRAIKV